MGIKTVAIYSDADANSLFVRMADEAVHVVSIKVAYQYSLISKGHGTQKPLEMDIVFCR
jgi:propionyl-CoA carboxylase alpha chain